MIHSVRKVNVRCAWLHVHGLVPFCLAASKGMAGLVHCSEIAFGLDNTASKLAAIIQLSD